MAAIAQTTNRDHGIGKKASCGRKLEWPIGHLAPVVAESQVSCVKYKCKDQSNQSSDEAKYRNSPRNGQVKSRITPVKEWSIQVDYTGP